jgi:ketosteroid isomerase-like protein
MSERNVELLRRFIEAYNARDLESFISLCDPQIEVHSVFAAVAGTVYRGHDGMRRMFGDLEDAWGDERRIEPEAYFDLGEPTLTFYVLHGRGKQSGAEVALAAAGVSRWRDGLLVYWKTYLQREGALKDLGVSEDALKPIDP